MDGYVQAVLGGPRCPRRDAFSVARDVDVDLRSRRPVSAATIQTIGREQDEDYSTILGGLAVLAGAGLSSEASAALVERDYLSHGTANCQSALPVFDGNIRKRPMALANEGAGNAFVTCDTESISNGSLGFSTIGVHFTNRARAAGVIVNCTLVDGLFTGGVFLPKSSNALPAGGSGSVYWSTVDNGGGNFWAPAISCNLPSGVDISIVRFVYSEEVGAL